MTTLSTYSWLVLRCTGRIEQWRLVRRYYFIIIFYFLTPFSPQFCGIQLVVTVLFHCCNSCTDSGEAKVESRASSETQPNQAGQLLDTMPT